MSPAARPELLSLLDRFVPVICRGLALGFAVLAVATLFGMGDHATAADRYFSAGLYAAVAVASLVIASAAGRMLRRLLSRD